MSERIYLSAAELQQVLNEQLAEHDECDGCTLKKPVPLQVPCDDGCNWSTDVHVTCAGRRANAPACARIAARIVAEAAREYNLKHWPQGPQVGGVDQPFEPKG